MMTGGAALLLTGSISAHAAVVGQEVSMEGKIDTAYAPSGAGRMTGKGIGDFDFLTGEWTIQHRRLKDGTTDEWLDFSSRATVHRVLDGMGSVEELRKADDSFMGMGVRMWLPQERKWADHWTSAANGIINAPQKGEFVDGEGIFLSEETLDGVRWKYRGVWDQISDGHCRWHQSASRDDGASWTWNWWMMWTRVG
jgi:hypothetical protein